jgi:hypothetical protein
MHKQYINTPHQHKPGGLVVVHVGVPHDELLQIARRGGQVL